MDAYLIERRWPRWRRIAEWNRNALPQPAHRLSWRAQASALGGIALLLVLLLAGLHSALNVKSPSPVAAARRGVAAMPPHADMPRSRYPNKISQKSGRRLRFGGVSRRQRLVGADGHPVPDIDGANRHQQPDDLILVEETGDAVPDSIRHPCLADEGD